MDTVHGRPGKERENKRMASVRVGTVGCSPLSNPLQSFQGFWDQNASPRLQPSTSSSVLSSVSPKQKMGTAAQGGHQRQRPSLGRRLHDGRTEWQTVRSGSTAPHLYQLWESPQDGFFLFKFNLILNATWRFSKYPYFLALKIQLDWFLSQVLKSS